MFGVHEVSPTVRRRISLAASLAALVVLLLGARLWNLQVLRGEEMAALSENNRVRLRRDPATRGRVVDRTGAVVIDSQASFDAVVVPEDARDLPAAVEMLAQIPRPEHGRDAGGARSRRRAAGLPGSADQARPDLRRGRGDRDAPDGARRRLAARDAEPHLSATGRRSRTCSATSAR